MKLVKKLLLLGFLIWNLNLEVDMNYYKVYYLDNWTEDWKLYMFVLHPQCWVPSKYLKTGIYCISAVDLAGNESRKSEWIFYLDSSEEL